MLNQFISAIEGGLSGASTRRETKGGNRGAEADLKLVKGSGGTAHEEETSREFADTPQAQFERLLSAAAKDPDGLDWLDITQPDTELPTVRRGTLISWECDFYTPEVVQVFGRNSEARALMQMMEGLMPAAPAVGLDTSGLPAANEVGAMAGFLDAVQIDHVVEGDRDDTRWKIFAKLEESHMLGEVDGPMGFVGKVRRVIAEGAYHPLISLPGSNFGSRDKRREAATKAPEPGQEANFISGPAIEVDLLAAFA